MALNKYYQDELIYLREMGREFAEANPALAPLLADKASDPDVERLLEGFAFLSGRLRQKLDDAFPELTHGLMSLIWPHYLRPIPSMSILEFTPVPGAVMERQQIPRGTEVASVPVDGTSCRFRTSFDVDLYPLALKEAARELTSRGDTCLRLGFEINPGITFTKAKIQSVRLYLSGEAAFSLYLVLCRYVKSLTARITTKEKSESDITLSTDCLSPVGFSKDEALLPYPKTSFEGYRLVQEYFAFPQKFLFVDLDLSVLARSDPSGRFDVKIVLDRQADAQLSVSRDNFRLYCAPIVNLFSMDSDPILVDHTRVEYLIRPAGSNARHYEIYSVDRAEGSIRGTSEEREYEPFYSFKHTPDPSGRPMSYYQTRLRDAVVEDDTGDRIETYVAFVSLAQKVAPPPSEIVTFGLTCTNRTLAGMLKPGDIKVATDNSPVFARFQNIAKATPSAPPPVGGDLYWRLISHLSLNYLSLSSVETLQEILELYNFQSRRDRVAGLANTRRVQGISELQSRPQDRLFGSVPVRGTAITLSLAEDHFAGQGDLFLFASVLNEFFALYASLNSFTHLTARGVQHGETYQWDAKIGEQILL